MASAVVNVESDRLPVGDGLQVVYFTAAWCGPCKAFSPVVDTVAGASQPDVHFFKVDVDANPVLAAEFGVRAVPTVVLRRGGAVVASRSGAVNAPGLTAWLDMHR